jgi:hypothetical protein
VNLPKIDSISDLPFRGRPAAATAVRKSRREQGGCVKIARVNRSQADLTRQERQLAVHHSRDFRGAAANRRRQEFVNNAAFAAGAA